MDLATARARLERMTQHTVDPVLSSAEITDLLLLARRTDTDGYVPYDTWAAATVYTISQYRVPTVNNGHIYLVSTAGTSGATEPVWPTASGATVTDGTVVWTERGAYLWAGTWDLKAAAAEGWRWKAAKVAAEYEVAAGGGTSFKRNQKWQHCMAMARSFSSGSVGAIQLTSSYARRWDT